jgi:hypothetical protein
LTRLVNLLKSINAKDFTPVYYWMHVPTPMVQSTTFFSIFSSVLKLKFALSFKPQICALDSTILDTKILKKALISLMPGRSEYVGDILLSRARDKQ